MRLENLQQQVCHGEYRVDAQAVAEAILRRLLAAPQHQDAATPRQAECS